MFKKITLKNEYSRLSANSPEVQEIVQSQLAAFKEQMNEQSKTFNMTLDQKTKELHEMQCKCVLLQNQLKAAQEADDKK